MLKGVYMAVLSLLLLCGCSSQTQVSSLTEDFVSEGISISELKQNEENSILDGVRPSRYQLDNNMDTILVYDFGSKENLEMGLKHFQERQLSLSSHAPIIYKKKNYLILYYSDVNSQTQTPKVTETKYGEKLQKIFNKIG